MSSLYNGYSPNDHKASTQDTHQERRAAPRIDVGADADHTDTNNRPGLARVENLSTGGAFLRLEKLHGLGSVVRLKVKLEGKKELFATAVVRTRVPGKGNGVEFLSLSTEHRRAIETLVQQPPGGYSATVYRNW